MTAVTVDPLVNDLGDVDPTTVQLWDGLAWVTSVTVAGEGVWTVDPVSGAVTFTPEVGFEGDPTAIDYQVSDFSGDLVSATITVDYSPQAFDDLGLAFTTGIPVAVDVLANDLGDLDPTTVALDPASVPGGVGVDTDFDGDIDQVTVPGEGVWTVDATTGAVTFTPEVGFERDPSLIDYTVEDFSGDVVTATITVDYPPIAFDDLSPDNTIGATVTVDPLANDIGDLDPASVLLWDGLAWVATVTVAGEGVWTVDPVTGAVTFTPEVGFEGDPTAIDYQVSDFSGNQESATITVDYVPQAFDDVSQNNTIGATVTLDPLANDSGDVDPTTVQLWNGLAWVATVTVAGEGVWTVDPVTGAVTFTPEVGFEGDPTAIDYQVSDFSGDLVSATITVDYSPQASDDASQNNTIGDPVTVDPLVNDLGDLDPTTVLLWDGDSWETTVTVLGQGTWTVDPVTGAVTFTPAAGFTGDPTPIDYQVADFSGDLVSATVTVDYLQGADDTATTPTDTASTLNVLTNDPDGGLVDLTLVTDPPHGTVAIVDATTGQIVYTPDPGFAGIDTFTYTACAAGGGCLTQTVTITVTPTGVDDSATTDVGTPVTLSVLDNDASASSVVVGTASNPANGTAVVNPDGTITYTPDAGFSGLDTFTYTACVPATDPALCYTRTATVLVRPIGVDDIATTPTNTPVVIDVVDNDGANGLVVSATTDPPHGTVVTNLGGTVTYTPDAGFSGTDTFTYTACDAIDQCITKTVMVIVTPTGSNDTATTSTNTPKSIDVLANDPAGPSLDVTAVSNPPNGNAVVNADGTVTYTPDPGFAGVDTFTYTACDADEHCITQTVTVTVTPTGTDDTASTPAGTPVVIDVLANDPAGSSLDVMAVGDAPHGTVVINPDGTVTYTPDPGFSGIDSFTYTACVPAPAVPSATPRATLAEAVGPQLCITQTVTVTVRPLGSDDTATTPAGTPVMILVLANDPAGASLKVTAVSDSPHGSVVINPDGTVTYTPDAGFSGTDTFTYTACDVNGQCVTQTVVVTVRPTAVDDVTTTPPGQPVVIRVLGNDPSAASLVVRSVTDPLHGTAVINADGTITYTPDPGFSGTDTFTYTACDASNQCVTRTVTVAIQTLPPTGGDMRRWLQTSTLLTGVGVLLVMWARRRRRLHAV